MDGLKNWRSLIALLVLLLMMSDCTRVAFLAANLPTYFGTLAVVHDLAYGPEPSQKLDIDVPVDPTDKPMMDVIVFFYSGRWTYGTKEYYRFVGATFAEREFSSSFPTTENIHWCDFHGLSKMAPKLSPGSLITSPSFTVILR